MSESNQASNQLISVIVPVYNVSNFLDACVNSILKQSHTTLEILLIDDGSKDDSGTKCDEFAKKDSRITVIHQENRGLSAARNTGLEHASGEYILFVDSDDCIHPQMCELLWKAITESNSSLACSTPLWIQEKEVPDITYYETYTEEYIYTKNALTLFNRYSSPSPIGYVSNKLYSRKLIGSHRFPEGMNIEDLYFNTLVFPGCSRTIYIKEKLYFYRLRSGSIMRQKKEDSSLCQNYITAVNNLIYAFSQLGDRDEFLKNLSRQLNFMARYETQYALMNYKESQKFARKAFLDIYNKHKKDLKFLPDRKKILLARYCLPLYHLLKKPEIKNNILKKE